MLSPVLLLRHWEGYKLQMGWVLREAGGEEGLNIFLGVYQQASVPWLPKQYLCSPMLPAPVLPSSPAPYLGG